MPNPLLIEVEGIWPVIANTRALHAYAVESAAVVLSIPGPGTTAYAQTFPVDWE